MQVTEIVRNIQHRNNIVKDNLIVVIFMKIAD